MKDPVIISAVIVFVVSGVVTFTNIGLRADFVPRWLKAFVTGWPVAAVLALCSSAPAAQQIQQVDVKLVLAVDVSPSIDNGEYAVEREGTAAAFSDPDVIRAIQNGSLGRIAVSMIHFSSAQFNRVAVDWFIIRDRASALGFAQAIRNVPRTPGRRTSISSALELGSLLL